MRNLRNSKGFTLIELMIVVVIIGILAAIAIPKFSSVSNSAKEAEVEPILKQICSLAEAERMKDPANEWPADIDAIRGYTNPGAKYFNDPTFSDGVASATSKATGVRSADMTCENKEVEWTAADEG